MAEISTKITTPATDDSRREGPKGMESLSAAELTVAELEDELHQAGLKTRGKDCLASSR
jgi:hypothetical protein